MSNFAFTKVLHELKLLNPLRKKVLVAASGGLDSQVLAHIVIKSKYCPYELAYVSHKVRSPEEELTDRAMISILTPEPVTTLEIQNNGYTDEHMLRKLRYKALANYAEKQGLEYVVTGHHADDQLETMLMSVCRGLSGFKPMPNNRSITTDHRNIKLIRPCLGVTKDSLKDIAIKRGLSWHEDSTNNNIAYVRNRLRKDVIPVLKELYPKCAEHVAYMV